MDIHTKLLKVIEGFKREDGELNKAVFSEFENVVFEITLKYSDVSEISKTKFIDILQNLDRIYVENGYTSFDNNQRLKKAYEQLGEAEATSVFPKGVQRLCEARKEIWETS